MKKLSILAVPWALLAGPVYAGESALRDRLQAAAQTSIAAKETTDFAVARDMAARSLDGTAPTPVLAAVPAKPSALVWGAVAGSPSPAETSPRREPPAPKTRHQSVLDSPGERAAAFLYICGVAIAVGVAFFPLGGLAAAGIGLAGLGVGYLVFKYLV